MARVTVVIPTYKRNRFLVRAIDSILTQTYKYCEVIVVDDNFSDSPYRTENKKLESLYADKQVRFLYNRENLGGAGARNQGLQEASGKYVAFLDDDDTYTPDKLEKMVAELEKTNGHMAYSYVKSDKGKKYEKTYSGNAMFELFKDDCLAATSQWLFTRECLVDVGGFDITPAKQDSILTFKLFEKGYQVQCVPEFLSIYFEHDGDRISNSGNTIIGEKYLYNCYLRVRDRFSKRQCREIEAAFGFRFLKYSVHLKRYGMSLKQAMKLMLFYPDYLLDYSKEFYSQKTQG